jgi:RNA polymerase sigma factor for flagellar operon FliA
MTDYKVELSEQEKEKIINDSLPFIKYTAYRLAHRLPPQLAVNDLISVGIVGLLDALQRYAEGRVKLNTFVEYRIKGAMLDELRSHDWVPRSLKTKIGQIKKAHRELEQNLGRMPSEEEIAERLDITLDEYYRTVQSASNAVVFSFEDFRDKMYEESDMDVTECIPDPDAKTPLELLEENSSKEALAQLIERLPEKEKLILSLYYWEELTMKEIGKILHLTEGRVCQLHNQALIRLKAQINLPVPR